MHSRMPLPTMTTEQATSSIPMLSCPACGHQLQDLQCCPECGFRRDQHHPQDALHIPWDVALYSPYRRLGATWLLIHLYPMRISRASFPSEKTRTLWWAILWTFLSLILACVTSDDLRTLVHDICLASDRTSPSIWRYLSWTAASMCFWLVILLAPAIPVVCIERVLFCRGLKDSLTWISYCLCVMPSSILVFSVATFLVDLIDQQNISAILKITVIHGVFCMYLILVFASPQPNCRLLVIAIMARLLSYTVCAIVMVLSALQMIPLVDLL